MFRDGADTGVAKEMTELMDGLAKKKRESALLKTVNGKTLSMMVFDKSRSIREATPGPSRPYQTDEPAFSMSSLHPDPRGPPGGAPPVSPDFFNLPAIEGMCHGS